MELTAALLEALVARLFPGVDGEAARVLGQYGTRPHEREAIRVRVAALKLSDGSLEQLRELISHAKRDYRDVLAWAEYPEEMRRLTWRLPASEQIRIRTADRAQYLAWHSSARRTGGSMHVELARATPDVLDEYARVPIAFTVDRVYDLPAAPGAPTLVERALAEPYTKDYDALPEEGPRRWPDRFQLGSWGILLAREGGWCLGAAAVAYADPAVVLLEGRRDVVVLWDLRVHPAARHRGIGRALFQAAEEWARAQRCRQLRVETQQINVPACRLYAAQGCRLEAVKAGAYATLPDEAQLLWVKDLAPAG